MATGFLLTPPLWLFTERIRCLHVGDQAYFGAFVLFVRSKVDFLLCF